MMQLMLRNVRIASCSHKHLGWPCRLSTGSQQLISRPKLRRKIAELLNPLIAGTLAAGCIFKKISSNDVAALEFSEDDRTINSYSKPPWIPSIEYESIEVEGWTIMVSPDFYQENQSFSTLESRQRLKKAALRLIQWQLFNVTRTVKCDSLKALRKTVIWLELRSIYEPEGMCTYHWSRTWLSEHGLNPDKAHAIEITNAKHFLLWGSDPMPNALLHELAHAYHDQSVPSGEHNDDIITTYASAVESGIYANVLRAGGADEKAYAVTNKFEYFASLSVCYFSVNDYFPFVRAELKRHDPAGYALMRKLWGPHRLGLDLDQDHYGKSESKL